MQKPIFKEITATKFTVSCDDPNVIFTPAFKSSLEQLIDQLRTMAEDGQPIFGDIVNTAGALDLTLNRETALRDIRILHNRIEQMMQELLRPVLCS